jgi:hypothetical protein
MTDAPCSFMLYDITVELLIYFRFPRVYADYFGNASRCISGWIKTKMNFGNAR